MNINEKLKRNISISYVYNFLLQLNITSAIWVLYLSFKGMSLIQIGLVESIYHLAGVLFELPTGVIADLYGKKFSVVLGRLVSIISCVFMITSNSFWGFCLAFALSAAAINLNSGAGEALIYDSLKEVGEEEKYKIIWGNLAFVMSLAQGLAVLFGGILADVNFLYAYIFGTVIQIAALMAAYNFNEPPVHKENNKKQQGNLVLNQLITSVNVLKKTKVVLYLILFSSLVGSLQTTVFFYCQQYFSDMSYSKTVIAIICAISSLIEAVSSKYAYKFEAWLNLKGTLISVSLINIFSLMGLAFIKELALMFFFLTSITGGLAFTIFSDYINSRIPSEYRATILSFDSLCFSIFMISVFPLFGALAEKIGFSITFGIIAILYIPAMLFLLLKLKKYKNIEQIGGIKNDRISFK
ncbi:MFS transporter [Clostridium sp.]|uniref:MFS transporter n=1 Tax=Clostridium sp. TaxID=1506 RepID=UPI00283EE03B|nr:MFS transporter [Clostridium sp.]MDR3594936.1 MFS transporter [Clostridium sp.]